MYEHSKRFIRRKAGISSNSADSAPKLEQIIADALRSQIGFKAFNTPVAIHFDSFKRRLSDLDNLSGKDILDGLVDCKVLSDDRVKYVQRLTHSQTHIRKKNNSVTITITTM